MICETCPVNDCPDQLQGEVRTLLRHIKNGVYLRREMVGLASIEGVILSDEHVAGIHGCLDAQESQECKFTQEQ